jgi:bifunctional UDP-N-acetylglucosamine pyrophosphorylase/glucosamine-1-phosphate N-acetyltransferase
MPAGSVVVLAAGLGTRMKSARPKVLQPLCGRPMLGWVLDAAQSLAPARLDLVIGVEGAALRDVARSEAPSAALRFVVQEPRNGTGHALQVCLPEVGAGFGPVVVLYGDMPLLRAPSLARLCEVWQTRCAAASSPHGAGIALLTAEVADPRGLGRVVRDADGAVREIVEERDANAAQRALCEVNLGVYAFDPAFLAAALPQLRNDNAQREYYLTDLIARAVAEGRPVEAVRLDDAREALGVNTLRQLSIVRRELQDRILDQHLSNGVYIEDPDTTYIDHGVAIGAGTRILPCTVIRSNVVIGRDCEVGPFTQLRTGTVLEDGAEIGNFTECKQARIGAHAKAKHLAYLGDVSIGARVNIGAGTIVANYDGKLKHKSTIGERAFIGSGTVLIAPVEVGAGALTGGGAVVTRNSKIPPGEAWVGVPARPLARKPAASAGAATPLDTVAAAVQVGGARQRRSAAKPKAAAQPKSAARSSPAAASKSKAAAQAALDAAQAGIRSAAVRSRAKRTNSARSSAARASSSPRALGKSKNPNSSSARGAASTKRK